MKYSSALFRSLVVSLFFVYRVVLFGQGTIDNYINKYKNVAIKEMRRTGVPASVLLAEGIYISKSGGSDLALRANNHFGVVAEGEENAYSESSYSKWTETEKGRSIVRYRSYQTAEASFAEYTDNLQNNPTFQPLLQARAANYKRWVKAFQTAQHPTDAAYSDYVLGLIKDYKLYELDNDYAIATKTEAVNQRVVTVNGVKAVVAKADESSIAIAVEQGLSIHKLLGYNELTVERTFKEGEYVFIENKKAVYEGDVVAHTVAKNQTIYDISQLYGMKELSLRGINEMGEKGELAENGTVFLSSKARRLFQSKMDSLQQSPPVTTPPPPAAKPTAPDFNYEPIVAEGEPAPSNPATPKKYRLPIAEQPPVSEQPAILPVAPDSTQAPVTTASKQEPPAEEVPPFNTPTGKIHVVNTGETLYSIAKRYNITVDQLKEWNALSDSTIKIYQKLIVGK